MKCKHDMGWLTERNVHILIHPDGEVTMSFQNKGRLASKIKVRCNYPDCTATRNAYLKTDLIIYGKVHNTPPKASDGLRQSKGCQTTGTDSIMSRSFDNSGQVSPDGAYRQAVPPVAGKGDKKEKKGKG